MGPTDSRCETGGEFKDGCTAGTHSGKRALFPETRGITARCVPPVQLMRRQQPNHAYVRAQRVISLEGKHKTLPRKVLQTAITPRDAILSLPKLKRGARFPLLPLGPAELRSSVFKLRLPTRTKSARCFSCNILTDSRAAQSSPVLTNFTSSISSTVSIIPHQLSFKHRASIGSYIVWRMQCQ